MAVTGYTKAGADAAITEFSAPIKAWTAEYERSVFSRPGFDDTPAITVASAHSAGVISSPAVVRIAALNTGAQVTGWDGSSDPNFRFWPGVFNSGNGANQDLALYGSMKPQGDASAATWDVVFELTTAAANDILDIIGYASGGGAAIKIEVNGRMLHDVLSVTRSTAGEWLVGLKFTVARSRRIRIYAFGGSGVIAVRLPTGQAVTKPAAPPQTIAMIGDSWVSGAGAANTYDSGAGSVDTLAWRLMRLIGGPKAAQVNAGIGGTGFNSGTSGGSTAKYSTRLAAVLAMNPSTLIIYGSQNDGNVDIGSHVTSLLNSCSSVPRVIVIPTLLAGFDTQVASVKAATLASGRIFLDVPALVAGSGGTNAPAWNGNRDQLLIATNDLHLTLDGHRAMAAAIFRRAARALLGAA